MGRRTSRDTIYLACKITEKDSGILVISFRDPTHPQNVAARAIMLIVLLLLAIACSAQACTDQNKHCAAWAKSGQCTKSKVYMESNCKLSCNLCTCRDQNANCAAWARSNECTKNRAYMTQYCKKACGICGGGGKTTTTRGTVDSNSCHSVRSIPLSIRSQFRIPSFHSKYTEAYGIPIVSSRNVQDSALRRACYLTRFLFADRRDIRAGYLKHNGYMAVIGRNEPILSLPEYAFLRNDKVTDWNQRARGFGATKSLPLSSVGEENIMCYGRPGMSSSEVQQLCMQRL